MSKTFLFTQYATSGLTMVADNYNNISGITLASFNNKIYGASRTDGTLLEWNNLNSWEQKVASTYGGVCNLMVYNNKLYAVTVGEDLWEWDNNNNWLLKASGLTGSVQIQRGIVGPDGIYAIGKRTPITFDNVFVKWDDNSQWIIKYDGGVSDPFNFFGPMILFNNEIYLNNANGVYKWVDSASTFDTYFLEPQDILIYDICEYKSKIYFTSQNSDSKICHIIDQNNYSNDIEGTPNWGIYLNKQMEVGWKNYLYCVGNNGMVSKWDGINLKIYNSGYSDNMTSIINHLNIIYVTDAKGRLFRLNP